MVRVERFDVCRDLGGPLRDDRGGTAVAARLVGQLPREDGGRRRVPRYDRLDIRLVLRLGCGVGKPRRLGAAEGSDVLICRRPVSVMCSGSRVVFPVAASSDLCSFDYRHAEVCRKARTEKGTIILLTAGIPP